VYIPLSVRCWVDAQRSALALVTNLPITIRFKKSHLKTDLTLIDYLEYQVTYFANGASSVLDPKLLITYPDFQPGQSNTSQYYDTATMLDPGEGYNILK